MKDCIIVGGGLAGVVFAHRLAERGKTFAIISNHSQRSSEVAGGIFNPVVLKRFSAVWNASAQMQVSRDFYSAVEASLGERFFQSIPLYRKFASVQEQNDWFAASDREVLNDLLQAEVFSSSWKGIEALYGLGKVRHTGRLLVKEFLETSLRYFTELQLGDYQEVSFDYKELRHTYDGVEYKGLEARRVVFCEGFGLIHNPFFNYLPLRPCKGELLTFRSPELKCDAIVKSDGFIFRVGEDEYKIGATYGWDDLTNTPTEEARNELIHKLENIISCPYEIIAQEAAVRPTVIDRRPLLGQHPKWKNYWILNGLGTRGVMTAPYVSSILMDAIFERERIAHEMNIERFAKRYRKSV
ncbi:MAG: FAD-binding oxidoreductase [Capnocytophaga sp.]|nr:FAD-binding oxidoreductase [Capnocytophaga sp.]